MQGKVILGLGDARIARASSLQDSRRSRRVRHTEIFLAALAASLLTAPLARAVSWINPASGDWNTGSNWSTSAVPTAGSVIMIQNGGAAAITANPLNAPYSELRVGDGNAGALSGVGTLTMSAGTLALTDFLIVGSEFAATKSTTASALALSGGIVNGSFALEVGQSYPNPTTGIPYASSASMTLSSTATLDTTNYVNIGTGFSGGATGTIALQNTASFHTNSDLAVGATQNNSGTLTAQDNATLSVDQTLRIGAYDNASGTLTVSGAAAVIADAIQIASDSPGAHGLLMQTGGTITPASLQVGAFGAGTLQASAGTLNVSPGGPGELEVAVWDSASGIVTVSGSAQIRLLNGSNFVLGSQNNSAAGTVSQTGGSVTFYSDGGTTPGGVGTLILGRNTASGNYVYSLTGGTLTANQIAHSGPGNGTLLLGGGTLAAAADSASFIQNLTSAKIQAGGAIVNTNGHLVTIAQPLLHDPALGATPDGGLTKLGAGKLTLAGINTYTGGTTVNQGLLVLAAPSARPTGDVLRINKTAGAGAAVVVIGDSSHLLTPATGYRAQLQAGFGSGRWDGLSGITSTSAQVPSGTATQGIGYLAGSDYLTLYAGAAGGFAPNYSVAPTDVLLRYTYMGDADLSGTITLSDYALIDSGFLFGNFDGAVRIASWLNGDFNYDGRVDYRDYAIIDAAFTAGGSPLAAEMIDQHSAQFGAPYLHALQSAVPEPSSLAILALGAATLLRRRSK